MLPFEFIHYLETIFNKFKMIIIVYYVQYLSLIVIPNLHHYLYIFKFQMYIGYCKYRDNQKIVVKYPHNPPSHVDMDIFVM